MWKLMLNMFVNVLRGIPCATNTWRCSVRNLRTYLYIFCKAWSRRLCLLKTIYLLFPLSSWFDYSFSYYSISAPNHFSPNSSISPSRPITSRAVVLNSTTIKFKVSEIIESVSDVIYVMQYKNGTVFKNVYLNSSWL